MSMKKFMAGVNSSASVFLLQATALLDFAKMCQTGSLCRIGARGIRRDHKKQNSQQVDRFSSDKARLDTTLYY